MTIIKKFWSFLHGKSALCVKSFSWKSLGEIRNVIGTIRANDQKYLNCQRLLMENTANARFECTYTLAYVLSLGHNCMLMITVIKNSEVFIFWSVM